MKRFQTKARTIIGLFACILLAQSPQHSAAATFANTNGIVINDPFPPSVRRATPYPSTIDVSGFASSDTISKITVTLHNLSHETPDDIDVLLVGPGGQNLILFSDTGGGFASSQALTLTFDDAATSGGPDDGPLTTGTYRASNFESDDVFLSPAPAAASATNLAVFSGTNPNGAWQLYVIDDEALDSGNIFGGWSLEIETINAPLLNITRSNSFVVLSWPMVFGNFQIQENTTVSISNGWSPVFAPRSTNNSLISVTLPGYAALRFFRLSSQ